MWDILSLATKSLTGSRLYIAFAVVLAATAGWGYYEKDRADGLEAQIELFKGQLADAKTIDEMNKSTARANELQLTTALDRQNEMFKQLAKGQEEQANRVLARIDKSQAATYTQYNNVTSAISQIQIQSCEGMVDELIRFPNTLNGEGSTK